MEVRPDDNFYELPLEDDLPRTLTVLRVRHEEGAVLVDLCEAVDRRTDYREMGRGEVAAGESPYRAVSLKETLRLPDAGAILVTAPESVLGEVAGFLLTVDYGEGGVYPWLFTCGLTHEEWLLHLRQLCTLHARLQPARESAVRDDPRVAFRVREIAAVYESHAAVLRRWVQTARRRRPAALEEAAEVVRERQVQRVLAELGPVEENPRSRPNPGLPRLSGERQG